MDIVFFCFHDGGVLIFKISWKRSQTMTNTTLEEIYPWHSRSQIGKITGNISLEYCRLTFSWVNNQIFLNTSELGKIEKVLISGKV